MYAPMYVLVEMALRAVGRPVQWGDGLCFKFPSHCDYFFLFQHLRGLHELLLTRQGSPVELLLSFAKLQETQDLKLSGTKKARKSATRDLRY